MEARGLPALLVSPEEIDAPLGDATPGALPPAEGEAPAGAPPAPLRPLWATPPPPPAARARRNPAHLFPPTTGSSHAAESPEAPASQEDKWRQHRAYQQRYLARGRSVSAEAAAALEAGRASVAAAAAEHAVLLGRGQALSAILDYTDGIIHAFSALRCASAQTAPPPLGPAGTPEVAADQRHALGEAPPKAVPMLRVEGWAAAMEPTLRRLFVPSDAILRTGARFAPTRRFAEVARFTFSRVVALYTAWETAPPAERPRAEAVLEALIDVRRRFLAAVLAVGRARDFTVAIALATVPPGEMAAAHEAVVLHSLCLTAAQRAPLLEVHARYCAAVKVAREELRAALAHLADAATAALRPEFGADVYPQAPATPGVFNTAAHAAAVAARAANECAEAEAVAVVEVMRAVTDVLTPLQLAVGQHGAAARRLVDVVRLLDVVAGDAARGGASVARWV
jgi:hypothetical protein